MSKLDVFDQFHKRHIGINEEELQEIGSTDVILEYCDN